MPEGSPVFSVEQLDAIIGGRTYLIKEDGEDLGEIDVDLVDHSSIAYISGVGPGEKINNGHLAPASLAVAEFLRSANPGITIFDINNQQL